MGKKSKFDQETVLKPCRTYEGHSLSVNSVVSHGVTRIFSASADKTIREWDVRTGHLVHTFEGHDGNVSILVLFDKVNLLVSVSGSEIRCWSLTSKKPIYRFENAHEKWITKLKPSKDGKILYSASADHTVKEWNLVAGECTREIKGHTDYVTDLFLHNESSLITGSADTTICVWDLEDKKKNAKLARQFHGHEKWVTKVVSLDGKRILSASHDMTLRMWDYLSGECSRVIQLDHTASSFVLNESIAYVCGTSALFSAWDIETGKQKAVYEGHTGKVRTIAFLDNFEYEKGKVFPAIISCGEDNSIRVWNTNNAETFCKFRGHKKTVNCLAIAEDSHLLFSGDICGSLFSWQLPSFQLYEKEVLSKQLQEDEQRMKKSNLSREAKMKLLRDQMQGVDTEDSWSDSDSDSDQVQIEVTQRKAKKKTKKKTKKSVSKSPSIPLKLSKKSKAKKSKTKVKSTNSSLTPSYRPNSASSTDSSTATRLKNTKMRKAADIAQGIIPDDDSWTSSSDEEEEDTDQPLLSQEANKRALLMAQGINPDEEEWSSSEDD